MPTVCAMSVYKRSQKFLQIRQKIEKDSLVEHLLTLPVGILELTESAVRDEQYKLLCQAVYSRLDQCQRGPLHDNNVIQNSKHPCKRKT